MTKQASSSHRVIDGSFFKWSHLEQTPARTPSTSRGNKDKEPASSSRSNTITKADSGSNPSILKTSGKRSQREAHQPKGKSRKTALKRTPSQSKVSFMDPNYASSTDSSKIKRSTNPERSTLSTELELEPLLISGLDGTPSAESFDPNLEHFLTIAPIEDNDLEDLNTCLFAPEDDPDNLIEPVIELSNSAPTTQPTIPQIEDKFSQWNEMTNAVFKQLHDLGTATHGSYCQNLSSATRQWKTLRVLPQVLIPNENIRQQWPDFNTKVDAIARNCKKLFDAVSDSTHSNPLELGSIQAHLKMLQTQTEGKEFKQLVTKLHSLLVHFSSQRINNGVFDQPLSQLMKDLIDWLPTLEKMSPTSQHTPSQANDDPLLNYPIQSEVNHASPGISGDRLMNAWTQPFGDLEALEHLETWAQTHAKTSQAWMPTLSNDPLTGFACVPTFEYSVILSGIHQAISNNFKGWFNNLKADLSLIQVFSSLSARSAIYSTNKILQSTLLNTDPVNSQKLAHVGRLKLMREIQKLLVIHCEFALWSPHWLIEEAQQNPTLSPTQIANISPDRLAQKIQPTGTLSARQLEVKNRLETWLGNLYSDIDMNELIQSAYLRRHFYSRVMIANDLNHPIKSLHLIIKSLIQMGVNLREGKLV